MYRRVRAPAGCVGALSSPFGTATRRLRHRSLRALDFSRSTWGFCYKSTLAQSAIKPAFKRIQTLEYCNCPRLPLTTRHSTRAFNVTATARMKEAIVSKGPSVQIQDSPIPKPGDNEILIKVIFSGMNPKDWKQPERLDKVHNSGDDIAGTVAAVGSKVHDFTPGQRVGAFHVMASPHGSYAEYAIAPSHTTFSLPKHTSFEEAASIPLAAMTAAVGLFVRLGLPEPWSQGRTDGKTDNAKDKGGPLVVYGGASAVGAFAIKLAKKAGISPIIAVAGKGIPFVEKLIDKSAGDTIVDYREGDDAVVEGIKKALNGEKLYYAFDAVSEKGSYHNVSKVLATDGGKVTLVLPAKDKDQLPKGIEVSQTMVGCVFDNQTDFAHAWYKLLSKGLAEGWLTGHPTTTIPGGLGGVEKGLKDLKDGKASATKFVFKIADTEGAGQDKSSL